MISKADHRVDFESHPWFETLEGRALPSVSHLPLITPVLNVNTPEIIVVVESYSNFPFAHRIEFVSPLVIVQSSPSPQSAIQQDISVTTPALSTTQTPVSGINNGLTPEANASSVPAPVPEETANVGAFASLSSFTSTASSARPVVAKPSVPDNQPTQQTRLILLADSPSIIETVSPALLGNNNLLPLEFKLGQIPTPPVQAITNRLEFIGGGLSVPDNALPNANDNEPEPERPPQAQPVAPAPDLPELLPLGGMLTHPLSQNELANEPWISEAMVIGTLVGQEGAGETVLTPELVGEMATLAACLGGFAKVNPPEVAAQRGSKNLGEFEIELKNGRKK